MADDDIVVTENNQTIVVTAAGATLVVEETPTFVVVEGAVTEAPAPEEVVVPEISYVIQEQPSTVVVGETGAQGPPGLTGAQGIQGEQGVQGIQGVTNLFIQPEAPDTNLETYAWIQTEMAGGAWSLWFEDGT